MDRTRIELTTIVVGVFLLLYVAGVGARSSTDEVVRASGSDDP